MKIALIGYSQAGKQTLFTLLTGRQIPESRNASEALAGIACIRDSRIDKLTDIFQPKSKVYAENSFVLCPDISPESGSTVSDWMSSVKKCDLICIVARAFQDEAVYHPLASVDPVRDVRLIQDEILLSDMQVVEKRLARIEKEKRAKHTPQQAVEEDALRKCMTAMEEGKRVADVDLNPQENAAIKSLDLMTFKPVLVVYNVSEDDLNRDCEDGALAVSCQIEKDIMSIEDLEERQEFMNDINLKSSGVDRVNAAAYDRLGLMSFYTAGEDECRAWTIYKGSTAPIAGGKIHNDIQRGFIRVEVIKYDDMIACGSEQAAKEKGKLNLQGKEYVIEDGDICHFLFNV